MLPFLVVLKRACAPLPVPLKQAFIAVVQLFSVVSNSG